MAAGAGWALAGCGIDADSYDHARRVAFSPEAVPASDALFPQAVASGAMRADSVLLGTRVAGASRVVVKVWRPASEAEVALVHEQTLRVPSHGNVKARVGTLAPATWYHYAFFDEANQQRSAIGKVRTAFPDDWKEPLVVSATSCASFRYRPFAPLLAMAQTPHDLWLHLGDVSYNDGAVNLSDYRGKWNEQLADPGYRALMASAGGYLTWDDHDFFNNVNPEAVDAQSTITAAKEAWFESLPCEAGENARLWRSYRWGKTAEFFVLDCRMERKPSTRATNDAQYISRAQMDWLKAGLKASPCHFKVLLNSVPITNMPEPLWIGQGDRWQGYVAAREELLGFIDAQDLQNVWFVSGDFHVGLIMRVEREGPRRRLWEITAGPAGNINPLWYLLEPGQESNRRIAFPADQFLFAGSEFLTTQLTFDPKANTVRVVYTNPAKGETVGDHTLTFGQS